MSEEINTKKCPFCGGEININAIKCKHCKRFIDEEIKEKNQNEHKIAKGCLISFIYIFCAIICLGSFIGILPETPEQAAKREQYHKEQEQKKLERENQRKEQALEKEAEKQRKQEERENKRIQKEYEQQQAKIENLELLQTYTCGNAFGESICGAIRNNSNKTYSYVEISIKLYDYSGNIIETIFANVTDLEPNETWKFKAVSFEDNVASYKVTDITGY